MERMRIRVWDPFVRLFHWSLVLAFAANALVIEEGRLHEWIGYVAVGLVAGRIVWGLIGTEYARFKSFRPSLSAATGQLEEIASGRRTLHIGHTPLGALMIYNLLAAVLAIGLSGWLMTTDVFWGSEFMEEVHEMFVTWAEFSVLLHVAAVIYESRRLRVNLPRAMLTGYKDIPTT